jgi:hypothetical protein
MFLCTNIVFYKPFVYLIMKLRDESETLVEFLKIRQTVAFAYPLVCISIKLAQPMSDYKLISKITVRSRINNLQVITTDTMYKYRKINHIPTLLQELPVKHSDFIKRINCDVSWVTVRMNRAEIMHVNWYVWWLYSFHPSSIQSMPLRNLNKYLRMLPCKLSRHIVALVKPSAYSLESLLVYTKTKTR